MIQNTLRCKSRLEKRDLHVKTQTPYFLPNKRHLAVLLIQRSHNEHWHCSVADSDTIQTIHLDTKGLTCHIFSPTLLCPVSLPKEQGTSCSFSTAATTEEGEILMFIPSCRSRQHRCFPNEKGGWHGGQDLPDSVRFHYYSFGSSVDHHIPVYS